MIHIYIFMRGRLHQWNQSFVLFAIEQSLRLSDEYLVALIILGSGQHYGLLGLHQTVEDLRRGLHLLLQSSVRHETYIKHHQKPVNVDFSIW